MSGRAWAKLILGTLSAAGTAASAGMAAGSTWKACALQAVVTGVGFAYGYLDKTVANEAAGAAA